MPKIKPLGKRVLIKRFKAQATKGRDPSSR